MRRSLALIAAVPLAVVLSTPLPAGAADPHPLIAGSGSGWAANEVNQWITDVQSKGLQVVYTESGSSQGKLDFAHRSTDYGVTDVPYQGRDKTTGTVDSSQGRDFGYVPTTAGGVAFAYHLTQLGRSITNLRLKPKTLLEIFDGKITNWSDPAITADNNGRMLEKQPITPVVHSEGSTVSLNVGTYFAHEFPKQWRAVNGAHKPTPYWPTKPQDVVQNGSDGVVNYIRSGAANGSIGMVEYSYALGVNLPIANVRNAAGFYVPPTQYDVAIALRNAVVNEDATSKQYGLPDYSPVYDATDRRAYPMSYYASMIIPTSPTDATMTTAKRQTLADFAYYGICGGQKYAGPIGYSPLPLNLVQAGLTQLARLKVADPNVDLTAEDVANCQNPTFIGAHPGRDHLGKIAPMPPACDRSGHGPCSDATPNETVVTIHAPTGKVVAGKPIHLRGVVRADRAGAAGFKAKLERYRAGKWTLVSRTVTNAYGNLDVVVTPRRTTVYRFQVPAQSGLSGSVSVSVRVKVK